MFKFTVSLRSAKGALVTPEQDQDWSVVWTRFGVTSPELEVGRTAVMSVDIGAVSATLLGILQEVYVSRIRMESARICQDLTHPAAPKLLGRSSIYSEELRPYDSLLTTGFPAEYQHIRGKQLVMTGGGVGPMFFHGKYRKEKRDTESNI